MQIKVAKTAWFYGLINLLLLLVLSGWLYKNNQAVAMVAPQLDQQKVQCVSYAPYYRPGDSPLIEGMWIAPAQIEQDLKRLSTISHCVRTYSVSQGMDYVPQAAAKLGMKVYLGAWVGWVDTVNRVEIKLAARLANTYPDTVKALVVGNEVLLRGEQDEATMRAYFALAKSLTQTPITYADVWEFWLKHKSLAKHLDFQTLHILPYWENNPVGINGAVLHAEKVMDAMARQFSKPIFIGETGWPSAGRQRGEAVPSAVNQARYVREFIQKANENGWQYNIIEAIDQPWKRSLEGTVGGRWGIMTADLQPKFSFADPVAERYDHYRFVYLGLAGGLLFLAVALMWAERRLSVLIGLGAFGAFAGLLTYLSAEYVLAASRDWLEWLALGGLLLLGLFMCLMHVLRITHTDQSADKLMRVLKLIFLYAALIAGYLLYFDGRYRDFPILLFVLPALIMIFDAMRPKPTVLNWLIQGMPAALAVMFAALCYAKEATNNAAACWLLLSMALAYANWPSLRLHRFTNKKKN